MTEKLDVAVARYDEISVKLSDPDVVSDNKLYTELMREYKNLTPLIEMYKKYKSAENCFEDAKSALNDNDPELRKMAQDEMNAAKEDMEHFGEELKFLLLR